MIWFVVCSRCKFTVFIWIAEIFARDLQNIHFVGIFCARQRPLQGDGNRKTAPLACKKRTGRGGIFVKIFHGFLFPPDGLTANRGERIGKSLPSNWQISPRNLRSNTAPFTTVRLSTCYEFVKISQLLSRFFIISLHLVIHLAKADGKNNALIARNEKELTK